MSEYTSATPAVEPVTLAEAKAHCRVDHTTDDDYIAALIKVAREWCENYIGLVFVNRQITAYFASFDYCNLAMQMPIAPIYELGDLTYIDEDGDSTTIDLQTDGDYVFTEQAIYPPYAETWPAARNYPKSIRVTYTAGFGATAAACPGYVKQAILLTIGHLYENRETTIVGAPIAEVPMATRALLDMNRRGVV